MHNPEIIKILGTVFVRFKHLHHIYASFYSFLIKGNVYRDPKHIYFKSVSFFFLL